MNLISFIGRYLQENPYANFKLQRLLSFVSIIFLSTLSYEHVSTNLFNYLGALFDNLTPNIAYLLLPNHPNEDAVYILFHKEPHIVLSQQSSESYKRTPLRYFEN